MHCGNIVVKSHLPVTAGVGIIFVPVPLSASYPSPPALHSTGIVHLLVHPSAPGQMCRVVIVVNIDWYIDLYNASLHCITAH